MFVRGENHVLEPVGLMQKTLTGIPHFTIREIYLAESTPFYYLYQGDLITTNECIKKHILSTSHVLEDLTLYKVRK